MSQTPPPPPRRPTGTFGRGEKPADTQSLVQQIMAEQKEQKQVLREAINKSEKRFPLGPVAGHALPPVVPAATVALICARPVSSPTGAAPARQSLMPLYCAGLWLAVNIAPGASRRPDA